MWPIYKEVSGRGARVGWMVAKAKTKKQDDTNSRVASEYDVHMYPQRANILLQGLNRHGLTVEAISGPHCQIGAVHWHHITSREFTWLVKSTLEKQNSQH